MGIKRNFAYSSVLTASTYLFPLLTYPYVSRVLGVEGIGICNFVDGIIEYFIIVSMMGVSVCGIREIAMHKENPGMLSKVFTGVLSLNAVTTLLAMLVLLIAMYTVPSLEPHRNMLYVGQCKLFMNLFLLEWFFTGMEQFAYITKRSLVVKLIYVASVFVFLHEPSDYWIYYVLTVSTVVINALINLGYIRRYVKVDFDKKVTELVARPFFLMGIYRIITSIYVSLNVVWLGFATDTNQVGYYTTATRLYTILIAFYTAFTGVMLPRLSVLYSEGKMDELFHKIRQSVELLFFFAFPVVLISVIFGPVILRLLVGEGFEGAYLPFRIIAPLIFIIGYEQVLVIQILFPLKQDKVVLRNAILGATLSIILNVLLVSKLGAVGSSLVWLSTEFFVLVASFLFVCRYTEYRFPTKMFGLYLAVYFPWGAVLWIVNRYVLIDSYALMFLSVVLTGVYCLIIELRLRKNEFLLQILDKVKGKKLKIIENS